jgi:hypothetical protein
MGVNDQQDRDSAGQTERVPALLTAYDSIRIRNHVRILKDSCGGFERQTMFAPIASIFALVPDKNRL